MRRSWIYSLISGILAALIGCLPFIHAQDSSRFTSQQQNELHGLVEGLLDEGTVGLVLWVDSPQGSYVEAGGLASVASQRPMTADAAFRVASNTKTFIAALMLILQEQGLLNLDDLVADYLPDISAQLLYGNQITLRQLLNHSSGIVNFSDNRRDLRFFLLENNSRFWQPRDVIAHALSQSPNTLFAPGYGWEYSNTNYLLAGLVIETITGQPVASQIHRYILDPLEMTQTYFADAERPTVSLIDNHTNFDESGGAFYYNVTSFWTAAAMISTAPDMLKFTRALYGNQLFSSSNSLRQMLDFVDTGSRDGRGYGLGVDRFSAEPLVYGHTGVLPGFLTRIAYAPKADTVVIIMANSDFPMTEYNLAVLMARVYAVLGVEDVPLPTRRPTQIGQ